MLFIKIFLINISIALNLALSPEEFKAYHEQKKKIISEETKLKLSTTSPSIYYLPSPPGENYLLKDKYTTEAIKPAFIFLPDQLTTSRYRSNDIDESTIYGWKNRNINYYNIKDKHLSKKRIQKKFLIQPKYLKYNPYQNKIYNHKPIIYKKKVTASLQVQKDKPIKINKPATVEQIQTTFTVSEPLSLSVRLNQTLQNTTNLLRNQSYISPIPAITTFQTESLVLPLPPPEVLSGAATTSSSIIQKVPSVFSLENLLRLLNIPSSSSIEIVNGCSKSSNLNRTAWVSPTTDSQDKAIVTTGGSCTIQIGKIPSQNICHLRLDFNIFILSDPTDGDCVRDRFLVAGHNINSYVPQICGTNSNRHIYIDVDTVSGPVELTIVTIGSSLTRNWEILISQIECSNILKPPANCLQYYTGTQGFVSSINYLLNGTSTYTNNLNYAICLRKESGFCSMLYRNFPAPPSNSIQNMFEIVNFRIGAGNTNVPIVPSGEAGVGLQRCVDDYLIIAGTRLCGYRLNDGSVDTRVTNNGPITDSTNGPFIMQFKTNKYDVGKGFNIFYQQYPC